MDITLLLTGNELMNGDIVDSNSAMIARTLATIGARIQCKVTVGDDILLLQKQMEQLSRSSDLLVVNGGLGPTSDDLTAEALSRTTGLPLAEHPGALDHLHRWCGQRNVPLNDANRKQAWLPAGCELIPNPVGSAVGFIVRHNDCDILCTPGVPSELRAMLNGSIIERIARQTGSDQGLLLKRFHTFGLGESTLQQWVRDRLPDWPANVELGFRAGAPTLEVKLQAHRDHAEDLQRCETALRELIGDYIVAEGSQSSLPASLIQLLSQRGQTLTTAESCTGGLIAALLTEQAGASAVFEAGVVAYANHIKEKVLGVDPDLLAEQGAVSEAVVRQMALGALKISGADYVIAVSGIAGPDGGSDEKPVGTVWIAWGDRQSLQSCCLLLPYQRRHFQLMTAATGLDLIRRMLMNVRTAPRYLTDRAHPTLGRSQAPPNR